MMEWLRGKLHRATRPTDPIAAEDPQAVARLRAGSMRTARSLAKADRVIEEYRRAEAVADRKGEQAATVVAEFREAQQEVAAAGERLVDVVEKPGGGTP